MEREYEAKALVSQTDFEKLKGRFEIIDTVNQTNIYFETKDNFFKANNSALRIRLKNDTYQLTIKKRDADGNTEWNYQISKNIANNIINTKSINLANWEFPFNEELHELNIYTIKTTRFCLKYNNYIIEADETLFNKTIDYELEIEAESLKLANALLTDLQKSTHINLLPSKAKIARYFEYNKKD